MHEPVFERLREFYRNLSLPNTSHAVQQKLSSRLPSSVAFREEGIKSLQYVLPSRKERARNSHGLGLHIQEYLLFIETGCF
jgi:hypothetical protein